MNQIKRIPYIENGRKESDIRTRMPGDLPPRKMGLYMDEALSKTKFGIFNYILIFLSGVTMIAVLVETCGISFVIPVSQCDFKMTSADKGILGGVSFFGVICSSHLWGYLADTKGRRRVIMPTLLVAFLSSCASSLAQNFYLFVALRFVNGFFISGSSAVIYAYLCEFHDSKQRGRAIMGSAIIFGFACLLVPIFAWVVINQDFQFDIPFLNVTYKPWRLFLVIGSTPGLLAYFILLFLPESPKFVLGQGNKMQAYEILRKMNRINNGKDSQFELFEIWEEAESIENRQRILETKNTRFPLLTSIWIQTVPLFKPPYLFSTILVCTIQFGIYATSNGFYMFFAEILNKMASNVHNFMDERISMCDVINMKPVNMTAVELYEVSDKVCVTKLELEMLEQGIILELLYAVGFIVISLLINRTGKFPILFFVLVASGASGIICMLSNIPLIQIYSFIVLMCCGMAVNVTNAATVELYPTASRAMAVCISLMFGRMGCIVGTNIAALLLDNHCETVFYLSGSSLIAIGILTYFIPNIHEKVESTEIMMSGVPRHSVISFKSDAE